MNLRINIDQKEKYEELKYVFENLCVILGFSPVFTNKEYDVYIGNKNDKYCKINLNKDKPKLELFFYLLSGQEEKETKERDVHGRFQPRNSIITKKYKLEDPIINDYALYFKKLFENKGFKAKHFWKNNKKYAVLLTHDVDYAVMNKLPSAIKLFLRFIKSGNMKTLKDIFDVITGKNNYWHFEDYMNLENSKGFRSAFFFATKSNSYLMNFIKRENEVTYNINEKRFKNIIKKLDKEGFEVGLHASYNAYKSINSFVNEKRTLEKLLGSKIHGLRHHYYHFNPQSTEETWECHEKAGFEYDASLAFNEDLGYRRGLAFPFYPYNHEKKKRINLLVFPTSIMDSMLVRKKTTVKDATRRCINLIKSVKKKNGLVVLDWHDADWNTTFLDEVQIKTYINVINYLEKDKEAWVSTPKELAEWWNKRANF
ncbi:polysaccharide deacetylase family protein [Candidatus Woesearchaeota archaeon]|nr:polysaccharide deacetylase family protein [Candidatus Woesearchaeota archaeon]